LCIDELSLGLAPIVVEQLLDVVSELNAAGVTIILVDQSVKVALRVAETAYFMEKGEIRFHGRTDELLERPDILRSVFLEGAAAASNARDNGEERPVVASPALSATERQVHGDEVAALRTVALSRRFGGIAAIDNVDLAVSEREIVGIIGPNGAGKTTLLDVICGYTPSESGHVYLGSEELTRLSPQERARRGLGRSFQDARLFPALTVEEVVAVALERFVAVRSPLAAALHLPNVFDSEQRVADRVSELIELLGLGAFRTKFVRELSTGSRRVVDLACLLAHRPSAVLLDEPSSGIAQRETEALAPLLRRVRDELGASLVVVEHDMGLISAISDRLVAMDQGVVIAAGPPATVLADPAVVVSYLGVDPLEVSGARGDVP
jgi:branched-chain amino acid transport system ATP-binding protein